MTVVTGVENFPALLTLKDNRDFQRLYRRGKSLVSPCVVTYVLKNKQSVSRYGITASKKIGKAVTRNRARRVIRAAVLELSAEIPLGFDLVFVARGKTPYVKSYEVKKEIEAHLKKLGVLG